MLTKKDKSILRNGTFEQQTGLLLDHWYDKSEVWINEAIKYLRE